MKMYYILCLIGNDFICGFFGPSIHLYRLWKKMPEFFMDNLPVYQPSSFYVHHPSHKPRDQWTKDTPMFKLAKSKRRIIINEESANPMQDTAATCVEQGNEAQTIPETEEKLEHDTELTKPRIIFVEEGPKLVEATEADNETDIEI